MQPSFTAHELANILMVSFQAIHKRAVKERWLFEAAPNPKGGGCCKKYRFDSLPKAIQLAITVHEAEQLARAETPPDVINEMCITVASRRKEPAKANGCTALVGFNPATGEGLTRKESARALLVARLVSEYRNHYGAKSNGAVVSAKKAFVDAYNRGEAGTFPAIYSTIGKTSFQSIERWDLNLRRSANDPFIMADRRGKHRKGATSVTPEQEAVLKTFAYHPNRLPDSEIIRAAMAKMKYSGVPVTQSEDTFRRCLDRIRTEDYAGWVFAREGWKALNEKCLFHITRDCDRIEVGDIAFADGHVTNFECLNPATGKPKRMQLILFYDMKSNMPLGWDISPSESTETIKVALYRSILTLGKIPKVAYLDNGRAFRGTYFTGVKDLREDPNVGLFERLGMKSIFAWPYHAETKPIEGFFKIFGELERSAPSFTGTCVENKPARMKRGELVHRKLYDCLTQGRVPTIIDAHMAIAHWIDTEYAVRPQAGHLRGKCPLEVFLNGKGPGLSDDDKVRLRLLMAEQHVKKIPRDGIKMPWADERFYHPDLFGRQNQPGLVRYDWQDKGRVYVYDADGKFICEAKPTSKIHPAAQHLGAEDDVAELARQIEMKGALAKSVTGRAQDFIAAEVVPEVRRQIQDIASRGDAEGAETNRDKQGHTDADVALTDEQIAEANRRFEEEMAAPPIQTVRSVEAVCMLPEREFSVDWGRLAAMTDMDRYELLMECEARGIRIPTIEKRWMGLYEKSEEYAALHGYFEDVALKFRLLLTADIQGAQR